MKRAKITIKTRPNRWSTKSDVVERSITAYIDSAWPGLAVHRGIDWQHGLWYVTHIRSKWRIHPWSFSKRRQAVVYAREVAGITDWLQSEDDLIAQGTARKIIDAKAFSKATEA